MIYVSSGSSTQPTPMQSSYAAGKKLLDKLALDMNIEYKQHNIDFQSIKVLVFDYIRGYFRIFWVHALLGGHIDAD